MQRTHCQRQWRSQDLTTGWLKQKMGGGPGPTQAPPWLLGADLGLPRPPHGYATGQCVRRRVHTGCNGGHALRQAILVI